MRLPQEVIICEVGPRDGFQNEHEFISTDTKVNLIEKITSAGFKMVEIGSFVHPRAIPQLADTDEVARRIDRRPGVEYRALATNLKGIERAIAADVKKVKLAVSASESHNRSNFNRPIIDTLESFKDCVALAVANGVKLSGAMSTAFGCPFEGDVPLAQLIYLVEKFLSLGICELSLSDTTGVANPEQVYRLCDTMISRYPQVKWNLHFHNTRGLALANILAGMQAGVIRFDAAFSGLGGCPYAPGASGNVSSEDLIHMCAAMGIATGINLDKAIAIAREVKDIVGRDTDSCLLKAGKAWDLVPRRPEGQSKMA